MLMNTKITASFCIQNKSNHQKNITKGLLSACLQLCLILCVATLVYGQTINTSDRKPLVYLNQFAVELHGSNSYASEIARKHGFINLGQVGALEGWYLFSDPKVRKRSIEVKDRQERRIRFLQQEVASVERLKVLFRVKRDQQVVDRQPNDPFWEQMWYMHCDQEDSTSCSSSMRITEAWKAGYRGNGVVVTILDDGIESSHPDLHANYDYQASIDINQGDADPMPRYDPTNENKHGTRCAGVVAAVMDNHICSVGVAYEAKIGGIRMLDGDVTDSVEAQALNHAFNHISIYSASWGPDDDGKTVEGPGPMARRALHIGASQGRGGKGSIFVWASGNGGSSQDSCACDGYINSIYTIGVSSVSQLGKRPWFLEACASTMAATYSSGESDEGKVVTTDLHNSCTSQHTGTSASAPMASGLIALMLEANSELTWRDVQHIIVRTSNSRGLLANDWVLNGAGYNVSHVFGFGLMDAVSMTQVASSWTQVPAQKICTTAMVQRPLDIYGKTTVTAMMDTDACYRETNRINYLEHVILRISVRHSRRGDLQIFLTSPSGTKSTILQRRDYDRSREGFIRWEFMTTHNWGENPVGVWKLEVEDMGFRRKVYTPHGFIRGNGLLVEWQLTFYGTSEHPQPKFILGDCSNYPQELCHAECVGCCGSGNANCKACRNVKTQMGNCVANCTVDQFINLHTNTCMPCAPLCETCNGPDESDCLSCPSTHELIDGRCQLKCDDGFYFHPVIGACRRCMDSCSTCIGRRNNCTSCEEGFKFRKYRCEADCSPGFYKATSRSCRPCDPTCEECKSASRCTRCKEGYFLYHSRRCQPTCGERYYPDPAIRRCRPCFPRCLTCVGRQSNQCSSCNGKQSLINGECVSEKKCVDGRSCC